MHRWPMIKQPMRHGIRADIQIASIVFVLIVVAVNKKYTKIRRDVIMLILTLLFGCILLVLIPEPEVMRLARAASIELPFSS